MIHIIDSHEPNIHEDVFIAWNAEVAGRVLLKKDVSVWFGAVLRGDIADIEVGVGTNIQDNATVHIDLEIPTLIGDYVTVGHNAVVHGCTVGDGSLIGMGSIILTGAKIGKECIVGAGALVTEGKEFPDRSLIVGSPARAIKEITDQQIERVLENCRRYIDLGHAAKEKYREIT